MIHTKISFLLAAALALAFTVQAANGSSLNSVGAIKERAIGPILVQPTHYGGGGCAYGTVAGRHSAWHRHTDAGPTWCGPVHQPLRRWWRRSTPDQPIER